MIPPEYALLGGVFLSFLLTAVLPGYKAVTWSFLMATFFMPSLTWSYEVNMGLPYLSRESVFAFGVLPATILFHSSSIRRTNRYDALLVLLVPLVGAAAYVASNDVPGALGASLKWLLRLVVPVLLVRWHLQTRDQVLYLLRTTIRLAAFYALLMLWEWRMSPQLHTQVYGLFQHQFLQMHRGQFFRPIVFFQHALDLGYLYGFLVIVAVGMHANGELRMRRWLLILPLLGLACSMSVGPIGVCIVGVALLWFRRRKPIGRVARLMPFIILFGGILLTRHRENFDPLIDLISEFSEDRAGSFQYRVIACEEYLTAFMERPLFGYGPAQPFRTGTATDSMLLIYLLVSGGLFVGALYYWYYKSLSHLGAMASRRHPEANDLVASALFYGLALAIVVDLVHSGTTQAVVVLSVSILGIRTEPDETDSPIAEVGPEPPQPS